jgi:DNA-binding beta-propeller fold protein YncE
LLSYSIDTRTGALTLVDDEVLSGVCSGGIALDPSGEFIYSASFPLEDPNGKVGLIDGFRISNGHLIPLPGTPFASPIAVADGQNPAILDLAITRDGKVLYASDPNDAAGILIFDRDTKTGMLAFREAFNSGSPFGSIAITPSGKFLLAPGTNVMFQYEIGPHGELTSVPGSPFAVPAGAGPLAVSPDGNFVASDGSGISMQRETQHGRLTLVPGSPFGGVEAAAFDMTFDPSGRFVLVPGQVFRVHPETGVLTKVSDFTPGNFADGITALQPCKLHDEHGRDSHGGDNKDYDNKKDGDGKDNGKHEIECPEEEGNRRQN